MEMVSRKHEVYLTILVSYLYISFLQGSQNLFYQCAVSFVYKGLIKRYIANIPF